MAEKNELDTMRRRVASVSNHLIPSPSSYNGSVGFSNTSMNDSYHRVHGEVPSHDAVWRVASDDSGKDFTDIVYEKAVGEAIAKVLTHWEFCFCIFCFGDVILVLIEAVILIFVSDYYK